MVQIKNKGEIEWKIVGMIIVLIVVVLMIYFMTRINKLRDIFLSIFS